MEKISVCKIGYQVDFAGVTLFTDGIGDAGRKGYHLKSMPVNLGFEAVENFFQNRILDGILFKID